MNKRTKACNIPKSVKDRVWERDMQRCVVCGSSQSMPNCHYLSRAHGGLGIEQNIVTLCIACHRAYDQSDKRELFKETIREYLKLVYNDWDEKDLVYKK